jgi:hypothetical protein
VPGVRKRAGSTRADTVGWRVSEAVNFKLIGMLARPKLVEVDEIEIARCSKNDSMIG